MYLQGLSSSLPEEVQVELYKTIDCLKNVKIMRNAYAIEYDCVDSLALSATLEMKDFEGLYGAGQFNGTSGYEEAAAQGLVAGINAALKIKGEEPMILTRDSSYIGTLIDDLVTKGTEEPYRMMTSRSEYRLLLRQDNADLRLTEIGHRVGLIDDSRYERFLEKKRLIDEEIVRINRTNIPPSEEVNALLAERGSTPITTGIKLSELLRRPELSYEILRAIDNDRPVLPSAVCRTVEISVKYEGYIKRELAEAERKAKLEEKPLPKELDYTTVLGLRLEAAEKLNKVRPSSVGQASRISGVNPADISVLLIYLSARR
jgi:tRNA uridine 5-carboxymethylaminomethyl modification enzyme